MFGSASASTSPVSDRTAPTTLSCFDIQCWRSVLDLATLSSPRLVVVPTLLQQLSATAKEASSAIWTAPALPGLLSTDQTLDAESLGRTTSVAESYGTMPVDMGGGRP
jgi:hypothetical protein